MKAISKRILALLIALLMVLATVSVSADPADDTATPQPGTADTIEDTDDEPEEVTDEKAYNYIAKTDNYDAFLKNHANTKRPDHTIIINALNYKTYDTSFKPTGEKLDEVEFVNNNPYIEGDKLKGVIIPETGIVGWEVEIPESGLYNINVTYYNFTVITDASGNEKYKSKSSPITRRIFIDGKIPYYEARQITFARTWRDRSEIIRNKDTNNDIRPFQDEEPMWQSYTIQDYLGYYTKPLAFYFTKGKHVISFEAIKESFAVASIKIFQEESSKPYSEIKAGYDSKGYKPVANNENTYIKLQAEQATFKSSPTLYPVADRTTPSVEPYHHSKIRLNTIGGDKWKTPGDWIEWRFDVKEAGLYRISLKAKQAVINGTYSSRTLYIDGQKFSSDTDAMKFNYSTSWKMYTIGDENGEYLFYFDKGQHSIKLEATLGDISDILRRTEDVVYELNGVYRSILMITGPNPDTYTDYLFDKLIPNSLANLRVQGEVLKQIEADVKTAYGGKNTEQSAVIKKMILIIESMLKKQDNIKTRLTDFKDTIAALGTWVNDMRSQPLAIDYILISSPEAPLPKPDANFFQKLLHELRSFFASFFEDYDNIGGTVNIENAVVVWTETGVGQAGNRDNANILKQIIDDSFTPETGIPVSLRLVAAGSLLPATLAGTGPDVCLSRSSSDAVNYALRGAVVNLNDAELFPDKDQVFAQFKEAALTPLRFRSGIYGLPETQEFMMMFYRTDILEELNLQVPETWDDVYKILPVLQNKNMNFGMPVPVLGATGASLSVYATLLYQRGGQLYNMNEEYPNDGLSAALDTDEALDAFKMWTTLFTVHKLPNSYDFATRFRSGEVPIALAGLSGFNLLSVYAPEIDGLWSFTLVPGTVREDGTVDHTVATGVVSTVMMSTAKDKEKAWKFMSWWTGTKAQATFGREIESMLGPSARYLTANVAALEQLPWEKEAYEKILEQWDYVVGIPEVPGSYYTGRNVEFAWKEVINNGSDPNYVLIDNMREINEEIARKREEFKDKLAVLK